ARGKLPDSESIEIPALWVAELYTPSTIKGLLDGIAKLGWEFDRNNSRNLKKWMADVREGRSAGWINLGLVSPPEAEDIFTDRVSQLPKDVKGAFPTLISVTPSITALVIYFLFNEHSAKSLEQPLKADYTTSIDRKPKLSLWSVVLHIFLGRPLR